MPNGTDGGYIHLPLNVRGVIEKSHLDIDPTLNVLLFSRAVDELNANLVSPVSAVGFSTAFREPKRYIIGDYITFEIDTKWYSGTSLPSYTAFKFNTATVLILCGGVAVAAAASTFVVLYSLVFPKKVRASHGSGGEYSKLD